MFEMSRTKKPVDECYAPFVEAWCSSYPTLGFNATSGKMIKSMIADCRAIVKERAEIGRGSSLEQDGDKRVIGVFQYILAYVARENHWVHRKSITTFASKLREVYTEIIHGKQSARKKESASDYINSLRSSHSHR